MLKRAASALLLLSMLVVCARANEKAQGYCYVQNTSTAVLGCTVTVYATGTTTKATIYADNLNTPLSNPFTISNTSNVWSFYAANARYDVNVSGGSPTISPSYTISDILLLDPVGSLAYLASNNTFTGANSFTGVNTFSQTILGSINGNAATATTATSATTATNLLGPGSISGTFSGNLTLSGNVTYSGSGFQNGPETFTQPGVFTNAALNQPYQFNTGAFPVVSLSSALTFFLTDGLSSFVLVPSSGAVTQADASASYLQNVSTTTNGVALYSAAFVGAGSVSVWSQDSLVTDASVSGTTYNSTSLYGPESDAIVTGTPTSVIGNSVALTGTGTMPASSRAYRVRYKSGTLEWGAAFSSDTAAAAIGAIFGATSASNGSPSQALEFVSVPSGGGTATTSISEDAAGDLVLAPSTSFVNLPAMIGTLTQTVTGTGACATLTKVGNGTQGAITCSGSTGASIITITPGLTAPHGWHCTAQDHTTVANVLTQTDHPISPTAPTIAGTVTSGDVISYGCTAF